MFSNLMVRTKILAAFSTITIMTIFLGIFSLMETGNVNTEAVDVVENLIPSITTLGSIDSQLNLNRRGEIQVCTKTTPEELERYAKRQAETLEKITSMMTGLEKLPLTPEEKKMADALKADIASYYNDSAKTFEIARTGDLDGTIKSMRTVSKKSYDAVQKKVAELVEYNTKEAVDAEHHAKQIYTSAKLWTIVTIIVCVVVAMTLGFLIASAIATPMRRLVTEVDKMASGDLRVQLNAQGHDEIGQLNDAFIRMAENIRNMISRIEDASNRVTVTSSQVYRSSEQMATGAEEVAAQAATVATAGEEMAATSGDIAQNCSMAAEAAQQANQKAVDGEGVVENTVRIMNQIAERVSDSARTVESLGSRSDQIGTIIGTIEDIADQTNLLALNAAIEAARAGEQGRGFAVVADEVRALAERTTRATREIGAMIKSIQQETRSAVSVMEEGVHKVEEGREESARSGDAIRSILQQINEVAMQVNQIATAAEEQTATTSEISSNMMQITDVVQQTARGAQESAAAAGQLKVVAEELQQLVKQFRL
jgi:methyl-accepting chemotaxis protein